jgi:transcriptional regulator with XRE-family HTH domain
MIRRRRLGEALRELREGKGYTLQALAGELGWSHTKLSRLENAKVRPDVADVMDLLEVLGVPEDQERRLIALARQANQRGWWRAYADMPQRQAGYAELEASATSIEEFALVYVPGLLQTLDYARTRFADDQGFRAYDVEAAVRGRVERQKILTREKPVRYLGILDEAVLRRRTAEPSVLREQLRHLVEVTEPPNVEVRVLPLAAAVAYASRPLNSFAIYHFSDEDDPELVSIETETSEVQLGDAEDAGRYLALMERVKASALDPNLSTTLIETILKDLGE